MDIQGEKKKVFRIDILLIIPAIILITIGVLTLLSTTIDATGTFGDTGIVTKQLIFAAIGLTLYTILSLIDFSWAKYWQIVLPIYIITLALLAATLLFGPTINNVKRWLIIGGFQLQASEIAKFTTILITATTLSYKHKYNQWLLFAISFLLVIPMVALIYVEPDGSMSLLTLTIWFVVAFTGLSNQLRNSICLAIVGLITLPFLLISITGNWLFIILGIVGLILATFAYYYRGNWQKIVLISLLVGLALGAVTTVIYSSVLRDYQKDRIEAYLNPSETTGDIGFNVNQARIAIGSGQLFGKGFGNGTQSKRDFIPEHQTDFIFASYAEEFGLLGSLFLLAMYSVIISRGLMASIGNSSNAFFSMMTIGITMKILLEVFINLGTNMGTIPATGIPLPLVSAGGSITIMTLFSLGVIQSIINSSKVEKKVSNIIDNY